MFTLKNSDLAFLASPKTTQVGSYPDMDPLVSKDEYKGTDLMQKYLQDAESSKTGMNERSHLAQLCSECILLFQIILKTVRATKDFQSKKWKQIETSLKRSY